MFAERKKRPLYSVQCSQLGIDPSSVETNLSVILQRANRWNAILLLDEADVYIRRRGNDLIQNAIVGVFLRVIEYASCILFMTTNLPDDIDDAIASRCIVRIGYGLPPRSDQRRIWRVLADVNGITLGDDVIEQFSARHPRISGRDVKSLLKLASFSAAHRKRPIDADILEEALRYKPTASTPSTPSTPPPSTLDLSGDAILDRPIYDLDISTPAMLCLQQARLATLGEVCQKTRNDILVLRDANEDIVEEIREALSRWRLCFSG